MPALPTVSFENGHLSGGRDVLDRIIRTGKAERVVPEFGKPTFPSQIHLFELSPSICNSINGDDRKQMLGDLATAGLLHLPFEQIAVRFYLPDLKPKSGQKVLLTFCASGTLSIHPKDTNLVLAEKMGERIEMKSLTGKSQILTVGDVAGKGAMTYRGRIKHDMSRGTYDARARACDAQRRQANDGKQACQKQAQAIQTGIPGAARRDLFVLNEGGGTQVRRYRGRSGLSSSGWSFPAATYSARPSPHGIAWHR